MSCPENVQFGGGVNKKITEVAYFGKGNYQSNEFSLR